MAKSTARPGDYIVPLNMNGMQGRMLRLPATKSGAGKEILIIYGHHAMLERWWGFAQNFNAYGNVTMPDLPGFGGMDSFAKIGQKPTIDNLADYLAAFCKLRYKRRRFTVLGISFGFAVVTRMLQRYPELAGKVDLAVSMVGFMSHKDFCWSRKTMLLYRFTSRLLSLPGMTQLFKLGYINKWAIGAGYGSVRKKRQARTGKQLHHPDDLDRIMEVEMQLWRANDVRTHMLTTNAFLHIDNTKKRIDVPACHIGTTGDFYVDNIKAEQHMRAVFSDVTSIILRLTKHTPSIIATKEESAEFIPPRLRKMLRKT